MGNLFEGRTRKVSYNGYEERTASEPKSALYYQSKMDGLVAIKEANEEKAAELLSEFLVNKAESTNDEAKLMISLKSMLERFTVEEQNRILSKALIKALTRIA